MGLERNYKNISESTKILKWTIAIALVLNLGTIHEWLKQKEVSAMTTSFLKLTEALNDIGNLFHLNTFRNVIRDTVFDKPVSLTASDARLNPLAPDLSSVPDPQRNVAAVGPINILPDDVRFEFDDLDVIDDLIGESSAATAGIPGPNGVLVIGDSILKSGLQEHFERNLIKKDQTVTIELKSKSGTGLSRPDVFDWLDFVDKTKGTFQKMVIFLGTNDAQNLLNGKIVIPFDSKEWRDEYGLRVRKLLQKACSKSKQVYWVSSLRMKSESFDAKMRSLHDVVRREIKDQPSCAQFVSAGSWFTKKSKYTDTWVTETKKNGKKTIKLRVSDGIHLTYWGADLFSQKLIESIYE